MGRRLIGSPELSIFQLQAAPDITRCISPQLAHTAVSGSFAIRGMREIMGRGDSRGRFVSIPRSTRCSSSSRTTTFFP